MKKAISILLITCLLFSLTACGSRETLIKIDSCPTDPLVDPAENGKEPADVKTEADPPSAQEETEHSQEPADPVVNEEPVQSEEEPYPTIKLLQKGQTESGNFFVFKEGKPDLQFDDSRVFSKVTVKNGKTVTAYDPEIISCEKTRWDRYVHPEKTEWIDELKKYREIANGKGLIVVGVLEGEREGHYQKTEEFPFDDIYTLSNLRVEHVFCGDAEAGDVLRVCEDYYLVKEENQPAYYYKHNFTTGYAEPLNNGELRLFFLQESPRGGDLYMHALDSYWVNEDYLDYENRELARYLDLICRDPGEPTIPFWSEKTIFHPDGTISQICIDGYYGDKRPREEVLAELKTYQVYTNVMEDFKVEIPYENMEK